MATADINAVLAQAVRQLNAGGYQNLIDVITTSGSAVITSATAPWSPTDVGRSIAIIGVGATAGSIFVGTIASYASATQVSVSANLTATFAAGTPASFGGQIDDDRRSLQELIELAFEADEKVILEILNTPGHWALADLIGLLASISNGAALPAHVGGVPEVYVQRVTSGTYFIGRKENADLVDRFRNATVGIYSSASATATGSMMSGIYNIDGNNVLTYVGIDAKIRGLAYVRGANLQSPAIATRMIISTMLGIAFAKEGDDMGAANFFGGKSQQEGAEMQ